MDKKLRRRFGAAVTRQQEQKGEAGAESPPSPSPSPSRSSPFTRQELWMLLAVAYAVAGIAYGLYLPSKHGVFVYDDKVAIVRNPDVGYLQSEVVESMAMPPVSQIFSNDYWGTPLTGVDKWTHKSYRPLTILTYRTDVCRHAYGTLPCLFGIWGDGVKNVPVPNFVNALAKTFHMTNIYMHGLCSAAVVVTVYVAVFRRFWHTENDRKSALLAAGITGLLYAVHPSRVEAVASVVGRADTIACLLVLVAVLMYSVGLHHVGGVQQVLLTVLSVAVIAIATLFKETGASGAALVVGLDFYHSFWFANWNDIFVKGKLSRKERVAALRIACVTAVSAFLLSLRINVTGGDVGIDMDIYFNRLIEYGFWYRMANVPWVFLVNLDRMLLPTWLAYDYSDMPLVTPSTTVVDAVRMALSALPPLAIIAGIFYVASSRKEAKTTLTVLSGWLVVSLLPSSHIFFPVGFLIAERVLCMASVALCGILAVCFVCVWREKRRRALAVILLATFLGLSVGHTSDRILAWENEKTLFISELEVFPQHEPSLHGMGWLAYQHRDLETAAKYFLNPALHHHAESAWMLGRVYYQQGQMEQARDHLTRAVELNPVHKANNELGVVYWSLGDQTKAFDHVLFALHAQLPHGAPERRAILNNAACMYLLIGKQPGKALELLEEALSLYPDPVHLQNLIYTKATLGMYQEAVDALQILQSRGGGMDMRSREMATKLVQLLAKPGLPNTIPPFCTMQVVD